MFILNLLAFLLTLGVLVLVHEFGHFIVAKKSGVRVEEFCIGFPPRIWSKYYKGTKYSIGAIPFGGFVNMFGEFGEPEHPDSFTSKSVRTRALITIAGVVMNFILAIVIFTIALSTVGLPMESSSVEGYHPNVLKREIAVLGVIDASPAYEAGLQSQDVILQFNGQTLESEETISNFFSSHAGAEVALLIKRGSENIEKKVKVVAEGENKGKIGIAYGVIDLVRFPVIESIGMAFILVFKIVLLISGFFSNLIKYVFEQPEVLQQVSGPIGIYFLIKESLVMGIAYFLFLLGQISAILAFMNILPFPGFDGSRLVFLAIEKIRGKKITPKIENAVYGIGFILILILFVLISYQDILKYILGG